MDLSLSVLAIPDWLEPPLLIAAVIVGFSAVIFVHELGHFLAAKFFGIRVERFAIGFGPRLIGFKWGETDYCINILPLGGYVKMPGQEDLAPTEDSVTNEDPRSFNNKSVGARMWVVSAGVIMNVIFAIIAFMIVFLVGALFPPNKVGDVQFGSPAYGHIQPGWVVTEVGGDETRDFQSVTVNVALSAEDEPLALAMTDLDGKLQKLELQPEPGAFQGLRSIGLSPETTLRVPENPSKELQALLDRLEEESFVSGKLQGGDRIVAVDGRPVEFYSEMVRIIRAGTGTPVEFTIVRQGEDGESQVTAVYRPTLPAGSADHKLQLLGLRVPLEVRGVVEDRPADGKLKKGDIIARIGETPWPSFGEFTRACKENRNQSVSIVVLRDGKQIAVDVTPEKQWYESAVKVGVGMSPHNDSAIVGQVDEGSPMADAGLTPGAIIVGAWASGTDASPMPATQPDVQAAQWHQVVAAVRGSAGGQATIRIWRDGAYHDLSVDVPAVTAEADWTKWFVFESPTPAAFEMHKITYSAGGNPLVAAGMGLEKTWLFIEQAYITLDRLIFSESVGVEHLTGPVGIADISYQMAKAGWVELLYFLALISANLAVINFLPLPIVDGGLMTFLIYEKIRKKAVSLRVMQIANYIGVALLVTLFLVVTWQDILRIIGRLASS